MLANLSIFDIVLLICAIGVAMFVPITLFGRLRFARLAAELRRSGQGATLGPGDPWLQAFTFLTFAQAALDIAIACWFAYSPYVALAPRASIAMFEPLWPWLGVGAVRMLLEFVIRSLQRTLRERYAIQLRSL
jgi:hypothetical protein